MQNRSIILDDGSDRKIDKPVVLVGTLEVIGQEKVVVVVIVIKIVGGDIDAGESFQGGEEGGGHGGGHPCRNLVQLLPWKDTQGQGIVVAIFHSICTELFADWRNGIGILQIQFATGIGGLNLKLGLNAKIKKQGCLKLKLKFIRQN